MSEPVSTMVALGFLMAFNAGHSPSALMNQVPDVPKDPPPAIDVIVGKVTRVVDGDTIVVSVPGRGPVKVRFAGVDAPEKDQPGGALATAMVLMLSGQPVTVRVRTIGAYGRVVGDVLSEKGRWVNLALACSGLAWPAEMRYDPHPAIVKCWKFAVKARVGLWSLRVRHVAPWEWRKNKKGAR